MRSRGGALHTRPDGKMGRGAVPNYVGNDARSWKRMLKRHARKKRRQRDRVDG